MTTSLEEEIRNAPDPEPDVLLAGAAFDEDEAPPPVKRRTRRTRTPRVDENGEPVSRQPRNARLKDDLLDAYVEFASSLAVAAPTTSGVLMLRAEQSIDGLVSVCQGHPRAMAALKRVGQVSHGVQLFQTVILVAFAVAIDVGQIDPESYLTDKIAVMDVRRDEKGRAVKDEHGRIIKQRTTLRDIYDSMHGGRPESPDEPVTAPPSAPATPARGGPVRIPPMNWVPGAGA